MLMFAVLSRLWCGCRRRGSRRGGGFRALTTTSRQLVRRQPAGPVCCSSMCMLQLNSCPGLSWLAVLGTNGSISEPSKQPMNMYLSQCMSHLLTPLPPAHCSSLQALTCPTAAARAPAPAAPARWRPAPWTRATSPSWTTTRWARASCW